ncbi:hypothetical protein P4O66_001938 [Electrophorus voltai]|uniref:Uncharacterized protein n=1 Tax=Electrophorus voltai TaxID=2609070 RepID=A0AAD8ZYS8_9TELE|nr:hypothetical protein P4O66_001938 [Electrophorus voltai]
MTNITAIVSWEGPCAARLFRALIHTSRRPAYWGRDLALLVQHSAEFSSSPNQSHLTHLTNMKHGGGPESLQSSRAPEVQPEQERCREQERWLEATFHRPRQFVQTLRLQRSRCRKALQLFSMSSVDDIGSASCPKTRAERSVSAGSLHSDVIQGCVWNFTAGPDPIRKPCLYNTVVSRKPCLYNTVVSRKPCRYNTVVSRKPCLYNTVVSRKPCLYNTVVSRKPCLYNTVVSRKPCLYNTAVSRKPCLYNTAVSRKPCLYNTVVSRKPCLYNTVVSRKPCLYNTVVSRKPCRYNTVVSRKPCRYITVVSRKPCRYNTVVSRKPCLYNTAVSRKPCLYNTAVSRKPCLYNTAVSRKPCLYNTAVSVKPCLYNTAVSTLLQNLLLHSSSHPKTCKTLKVLPNMQFANIYGKDSQLAVTLSPIPLELLRSSTRL